MKRDTRRTLRPAAAVSRGWTLAVGVVLLLLGSGCVSWDPIFRGSMGVLRWMSLAR